jgi:hypothetical protein
MDFSIVILVLWAVSLLWYRRDARALTRRLTELEVEVKTLTAKQDDIKLKNTGARRSVGTSDFH